MSDELKACRFAWTPGKAEAEYEHYPPYVNLTDNRLAIRGPEKRGNGHVQQGDYVAVELTDEALDQLAAALASRTPSDEAEVERVALSERIDTAMFAVGNARLQLARLLDHASVGGLSDQSALAQETFAAIQRLDEAFPRTTDMGTGLPRAALRSTTPASDGGDK